MNRIYSLARAGYTYLRAHPRYAVGGLIILGLIVWSLSGGEEVAQESTRTREVRVSSVAELSSASTLSLVGNVVSKNEAELRTEAGGRITRVNADLGSFVGAGSIIAEIENSAQRAALLQAEGAFDAAKASTGGSRGSALTTVLSAYAAIDTAVEDAVGQIFSDPESSDGTFTVSSKDSQALADIRTTRPTLRPMLERHEVQSVSLSSSSDLAGELAILEDELRKVRTYLDIVLKALNAAVAREDISTATISGYITDVTGARSSVTASLSAVIAARTSLENGSGTVSASTATLKQAEGAYNAALSNLEKTRIRAPFSGTLTNFSIDLGDFVSPSQLVGVVSNTGALEIITSITESERSTIAVGNTVAIEGGAEGVVTKIAPAIDPITKRIEVRVALRTGDVTSGDSVRIEIARPATEKQKDEALRIPLTALKIEPDRSVVFTVENGVLIAHPVTSGAVRGALIEITEGVTSEMRIVVDARGLKEGDAVAIGARD